MPYNNAPISPPDEATGTSSLPLARVKKIISQDEDIAQCSNNAAFAISVATEIFIRYLTEQAYNVVKSERKPRRNIAYKDIATAVSRIDNLEFLSDTVPKTQTFGQFKERKAAEEAAARKPAPGPLGLPNGVNGHSKSKSIDKIIQQQSQQSGVGNITTNGIHHTEALAPIQAMNGSPIVDRTLQSPHGHPDPVRDIEMSG